jgi:hypothetical protein
MFTGHPLVSERGRPEPRPPLPQLRRERSEMSYVSCLAGFALACLLLAAPTVVFCLYLSRHTIVPGPAVAITACGGTCVLSYVVFWLTFWNPFLGTLGRFAVLAGGLFVLARLLRRRGLPRATREWLAPLGLALAIGIGCISVLFMWGNSAPLPYQLAANRFLGGLPIDNFLPDMFAHTIEHNAPLNSFTDDWLTSDRPPLQAALIVTAGPPLEKLGFVWVDADFPISILFQLMWVSGLWAVVRGIGATRRLAVATIGITATTGAVLLNTAFTWPKLGAAGLLLGAWALIVSERRDRWTWGIAGGLIALAYLSHGAALFPVLAVPIVCLGRRLRPSGVQAASAAFAIAILVVPWMAYQRWIDPPGDRLLKYHLAGVTEVDQRSFLRTVRDSYRAAGVSGTVSNKRSNLTYVVNPFDRGYANAFELGYERRVDEFFMPTRAIAGGLIFLLLMPIALARRKRAPHLRVGPTMAWVAVSLLLWALLMFGPRATIVHQGSYAPLLLLIAIPAAIVRVWSRGIYATIVLVHLLLFANWLPRQPEAHGALDLIPTAITLTVFGALGLAGLVSDRRLLPATASLPGLHSPVATTAVSTRPHERSFELHAHDHAQHRQAQ